MADGTAVSMTPPLHSIGWSVLVVFMGRLGFGGLVRAHSFLCGEVSRVMGARC